MARYFGSLRYFRTPSCYGFVAADMALTKEISIYTDVEFIGSVLAPYYAGYIPEDRLERTPSFTDWGVKLVREFHLGSHWNASTSLRLYVGIDNVLDSYQPDLDQGPLRDSRYMYGPRSMRTLSFGIMTSF